MAAAQCVIRSSRFSAWQSMDRHYVRFELVHACRPMGNTVREKRQNGAFAAIEQRTDRYDGGF